MPYDLCNLGVITSDHHVCSVYPVKTWDLTASDSWWVPAFITRCCGPSCRDHTDNIVCPPPDLLRHWKDGIFILKCSPGRWCKEHALRSHFALSPESSDWPKHLAPGWKLLITAPSPEKASAAIPLDIQFSWHWAGLTMYSKILPSLMGDQPDHWISVALPKIEVTTRTYHTKNEYKC